MISRNQDLNQKKKTKKQRHYQKIVLHYLKTSELVCCMLLHFTYDSAENSLEMFSLQADYTLDKPSFISQTVCPG